MVNNPSANAGDTRDVGSIPGLGRSLERAWQPTPVFLPGEPHGQRGLVGYSSRGCKKSDTTEMTEHISWSVTGWCYLRGWSCEALGLRIQLGPSPEHWPWCRLAGRWPRVGQKDLCIGEMLHKASHRA